MVHGWPIFPCAVYQTGRRLSSKVNQIAIASSPTLKSSKPLPERAGSHHWPCVKGERSATVAADTAVQAASRRAARNARVFISERPEDDAAGCVLAPEPAVAYVDRPALEQHRAPLRAGVGKVRLP